MTTTISDRALAYAATAIALLLASLLALLSVVAVVAVHQASGYADRLVESREASAMCRDAMLQCAARRDQMTQMLELAATGRARNANVGGGP